MFWRQQLIQKFLSEGGRGAKQRGCVVSVYSRWRNDKRNQSFNIQGRWIEGHTQG